jgi:hypothetical protein
MKEFDTEIYTLQEPVGFDLEVLSIQNLLAKVGWLEAAFGVAHVQKRMINADEASQSQGQGERQVLYPQSMKGDIDEDLTFNDNYASRVFFLTRDDIQVSPKTDVWNWVNNNVEIAQPFSLILHCNINSLEVNSTEKIKLDILRQLINCPKVTGVEMFEDMKNVWREFTITNELNGLTRRPNYCLRVDAILTYLAFPYNGEDKYNPNFS